MPCGVAVIDFGCLNCRLGDTFCRSVHIHTNRPSNPITQYPTVKQIQIQIQTDHPIQSLNIQLSNTNTTTKTNINANTLFADPFSSNNRSSCKCLHKSKITKHIRKSKCNKFHSLTSHYRRQGNLIQRGRGTK